MDPEIIQGGLMQNLGMDEGTAYRYAAEISASPELYGDVLAKIGLSDGFQAGFRAANDPRAVVNRSNMTLADWRIAGDALVGALREAFNPRTDTLGMEDTGMAAASTSMRPTEDIPMPNLGRFILGGIADPVGIGEDIASTAADPSLANLGLTAIGMLPFVPAGMTKAAERAGKVTLLSSQRYLDDAIVQEKRRAKDYTVRLSPTFTNDGKPVQVVLDGHHALAAAKADGVSPKFEVLDAQADDRIGLLDRGKVDDFLEATYQDADYYDLATGRDFSWGDVGVGQ